MKSILIIIPLFCAVSVIASSAHQGLDLISRHARLARQSPSEILIPRAAQRTRKTCTKKASSPKSTSAAAPKKTNEAKVVTSGGCGPGVIHLASASCSEIGATKATTKLAGPNGNIDYLNRGVESGGWNPPRITMDNVVVKTLSEAIKSDNSAFAPCQDYIWIFEKYANEFDVFPIMLASIAMQESGCKPNTVGGAGEQGLMQLTKDKCGGAPKGNCKDPEFNIRTGAKYFKSLLDANGGSIPLAAGQYNGWFDGITKAQATAARWGPCCRCQNNLDYIHQTLNGWYQNINAYDAKIGKYFNLDKCPT